MVWFDLRVCVVICLVTLGFCFVLICLCWVFDCGLCFAVGDGYIVYALIWCLYAGWC